MTRRSPEYLSGLVRELVKYPAETPWLEFKHNNDNYTDTSRFLRYGVGPMADFIDC